MLVNVAPPSPLPSFFSLMARGWKNFSFYDVIVTRARGKSGPLFHLDVHDYICIVDDTRVEKDESHPGKVGMRSSRSRPSQLTSRARVCVFVTVKSVLSCYNGHSMLIAVVLPIEMFARVMY